VTPRVARLRLLALAATLATLIAALALSGSLEPERVRDWVEGFGLLGPIVFVVVSSLLTVALFPGPLLSGASGLLFGTALGTPVSIVAATLGASLAFSLSRWWAHDAIVAIAGRRIGALRDWVGRRGFLSVLYARLTPGVPYHLVNYAAGLTPIPLRAFAAATALGCSPRAFAYTALGGNLDNLRSPEVIAAGCLLVVIALGGLLLARRDLRASGSGRGSSSPGARSAARP
jgi:uncharacterized membrane protein YdjX (TVP38/TMEM64 family)